MSEQVNKKGKKWGTIAVPQEVKDLLERIKARSGHDKANWKVLVEALSFYDQILGSSHRKMKMDSVEKVSWYITKLSLAYGSFAVNPTEETTSQLVARLQEVEMRTHVNTSVLQKLVNQYTKLENDAERTRARIELNQAYKLLIKELIMKTYGGEENDIS